MREASYEDTSGRRWLVKLPDDRPDSEAFMGIHIGPPPLDALGLPEETAVRLHNQLFARRIMTAQDARARRQDIFGALQAAFAVDTGTIVDLYDAPLIKSGEYDNVDNVNNGNHVAEETKVKRRDKVGGRKK